MGETDREPKVRKVACRYMKEMGDGGVGACGDWMFLTKLTGMLLSNLTIGLAGAFHSRGAHLCFMCS